MDNNKKNIIKRLKQIWGENWEANMEAVANAPHDLMIELIPQSQIDESNDLVRKLN